MSDINSVTKTMASNSEIIPEAAASTATVTAATATVVVSPTPPTVAKQQTETEQKTEPRSKATRHPRWTRQETLVLIEAKKLVESGEQINRFKSPPGFVFHQTDPKWDLVSSLCQQQGVKRGAVQCRKRWGNLLTDFRKIKKWESGIKEESESFWMMRNDKRKERKLPGFFDSVVYNVLDGGVCTAGVYPLTLVKVGSKQGNVKGDDHHHGGGGEGVVVVAGCSDNNNNNKDVDDDGDGDDDMVVEDDETTIVDSEMEWSTEEENNATETNHNNMMMMMMAGSNRVVNAAATPLLKTPTQTYTAAGPKEALMMMRYPRMTMPSLKLPASSEKQAAASGQGNLDPGKPNELSGIPFENRGLGSEWSYIGSGFERGTHKRKRVSQDNDEDTTNLGNDIVKIMRRNSNILKAHLGAQNMNYQLAREQQKEQTDSLVAALGKLTDAISKIADKL